MGSLISMIFIMGAVSGTLMILMDKWEIDTFISNKFGWWCEFCVTFWLNVLLTALVLIFEGWSFPYLLAPFAGVHVGLFFYRLSNGEY